MRITWFRALRGVAETETAHGQLKDMLSGKLVVPGVELRPLDRWNIVESLIANKDSEAKALFESRGKNAILPATAKNMPTWLRPARPDTATKSQYFEEYLHRSERPEDWIEISLGSFNWWNQSKITLPFLARALDALPQIKRGGERSFSCWDG